ncbi:TIGR02646 family protein [Modicisalibacter ilicicola DSM 19980]|uniref:TIGR02646 family protein n=1 Tax=Modicisalibacter ilicicola DSM 19980 TaxID=1121942 RepID=A0A1M4W237_9GAMM|nr:retron Ec78 anti-phage system effector HNH endonuclease PtuB [Halomonas ilicicola]SHE75276.1 TIGR02646 family protein [Halomonas ilicicola DSM 19980]
MHKLVRPEAPGCLSRFRHGRDNWRRDVSFDDKRKIWEKLEAMQGHRCAYCEDKLPEDRRHIEHFRQQSSHSQGTFQWDNLFGSCEKKDSCGRRKDRTTYRNGDILKPDVDDPDDYLQFLADGRIVPRNDLTERQRHRAEETLRVFNLDHERGALRQMRRSAVQGYLRSVEDLQELSESDESLYFEYLHEELEAIAGQPFETAIRHLFTAH